jgi:regulator of replication initiation timing
MSQPETEMTTQHSMLVVWGLYAQAFGLIPELLKVPLQQKTVDHSPQSKILEFFLVILAGLNHLQELDTAAEPIVKDLAVAQAWQQTGWAHHSGVSRTLKALTQAEAEQIVQVLERLEQPLIDREVMLALATQGEIILDGDLTPRQVSDTSRNYPEAAFGHTQGDQVGLGYQSAQVTFRSPTFQRLLLSSVLHPGDVVSNTQTENLVRAAEGRIGLHPLRRTDLLRKWIDRQSQDSQAKAQRLTEIQQTVQQILDEISDLERQMQQHPAELAQLEAEYAANDRKSRPFSRLAKLRNRLGLLQRKRERWLKKLPALRKKMERRQEQWAASLQIEKQLRKRLDQYERDNATNAFPIRAVFRLDAGFASRENLIFLIEMGYEVYTRPFGSWLLSRLKKLTDGKSWQRVGKNAEMTTWKQFEPADFPYPLDLALERFHTGEKVKHMLLLHFGDDPVTTQDLTIWFNFYNARQTIEAGNKEGKGTFAMRHLKVRSKSGLYLQEQFGRFAANFVRFASQWLVEQSSQLPSGWNDLEQPRVKQQVQVGAHTSANICWLEQGCLLKFTDHSVFAGRSLLVSKPIAIQLALPFAQKVQT